MGSKFLSCQNKFFFDGQLFAVMEHWNTAEKNVVRLYIFIVFNSNMRFETTLGFAGKAHQTLPTQVEYMSNMNIGHHNECKTYQLTFSNTILEQQKHIYYAKISNSLMGSFILWWSIELPQKKCWTIIHFYCFQFKNEIWDNSRLCR
jgi:hypothetical protein